MFVNLMDTQSRPYRVCVAMSGKHYLRGSFDTLREAQALQRDLHAQKWFYVPIYKAGYREPFEGLVS